MRLKTRIFPRKSERLIVEIAVCRINSLELGVEFFYCLCMLHSEDVVCLLLLAFELVNFFRLSLSEFTVRGIPTHDILGFVCMLLSEHSACLILQVFYLL